MGWVMEGLGAKALATGGHWRSVGKAPSCRRQGGQGRSAGRFLQFFNEKNAFLCI